MSRYVTRDAEPGDPARDRFSLYRLCDCPTCGGKFPEVASCRDCRTEGRTRQEVATCETPEAVGLALVTLAREGEWTDAEGKPCAFGLLDREGEKGKKWLVLPWLPSARNVRDAAKLMRAQQLKGESHV